MPHQPGLISNCSGPLGAPRPGRLCSTTAAYDALPSSKDVHLVVEIAVTSGAVDRRKARVYAAAGYQAYWILDVAARRLEVRSGPTGDGDWAETKLLEESAEAIVPGTAERVTVRLLLP